MRGGQNTRQQRDTTTGVSTVVGGTLEHRSRSRAATSAGQVRPITTGGRQNEAAEAPRRMREHAIAARKARAVRGWHLVVIMTLMAQS